MPYTRFRQELRLATRTAYTERRETMRAHALTAWQIRVSNHAGHGRPPDYDKYLRGLRLHPSQDQLRDRRRGVTAADRAAVAHVDHLISTYRGRMHRANP